MDLVAQFTCPTPCQKDQGNVKQQGRDHDFVGASAVTHKGADGFRADLTADDNEKRNCAEHDKAMNRSFAIAPHARIEKQFRHKFLRLHYLSVRN